MADRQGEFESRFIAAQSRVAPVKELAIPHLELQSAVVASCLGKSHDSSLKESSTLPTVRLFFHRFEVMLEITSHLYQQEWEKYRVIWVLLNGNIS